MVGGGGFRFLGQTPYIQIIKSNVVPKSAKILNGCSTSVGLIKCLNILKFLSNLLGTGQEKERILFFHLDNSSGVLIIPIFLSFLPPHFI